MRAHTEDAGGAAEPDGSGGERAGTGRVRALDALRGFALCGIIFANAPAMAAMAYRDDAGQRAIGRTVVDLAVQGRFFPIFSFLFGIGFAVILANAEGRSARPRLVLLRRLVALGLLGAAHQLLQPGEALLPYAIVGIVVLLPASFIPRWLVLGAGVVGTVLGVTAVHGGVGLIPGLFLLGMAVVRYGVVRELAEKAWPAWVGLVAGGAGAAVLLARYGRDPMAPVFYDIQPAAGLLLAIALSGLLILLLKVPVLGGALSAVLEPLGRMALTNYIAATLLLLVAVPLVGLAGSHDYLLMALLCAGILAVQALYSAWWLGSNRYGPLEWVLRRVTWWGTPPERG
ncbi:putative membrane protein YeiB [Murinocardiopsis flavida]|uniref:Putative membrane protein YeiB n=1 Tax=Murinocardiopsis flavida TaxID=645275 RepID=A0A2P8DQR8_9ACTN|nr:DUF418 domain-containing protein [Murinocardiopsis flavida]PSK99567.1 putative membrane protein YeiB [Murinocardiopsis flavida]